MATTPSNEDHAGHDAPLDLRPHDGTPPPRRVPPRRLFQIDPTASTKLAPQRPALDRAGARRAAVRALDLFQNPSSTPLEAMLSGPRQAGSETASYSSSSSYSDSDASSPPPRP